MESFSARVHGDPFDEEQEHFAEAAPAAEILEAVLRGDRRNAMEMLSNLDREALSAVVRSADILAGMARDEGRRRVLGHPREGGPF